MRYVYVDVASCDVSNNPDLEDLEERGTVKYHLAPSPLFENMENFGNIVSNEWTPWVNYNTENSSREFLVGQVFTSKAALQDPVKMYSIEAHQWYVVVASSKKMLVLRCKRVEECQCLWKLHAMAVKDTSFFSINKYKGLHTCVNPCLNWDHQQLNSNLVVDYIKAMIKTQFTLSIAAIQETIIEKFGYEISYKKEFVGKHKALTNLFGDFHKSYAGLPRFFMVLEQANPRCVVTWKTFDSNMQNTEVFQCFFKAFHPFIEGFNHCRPILNIDGTHLYGKYKGTLMIVMGADGNNQLFPLAFAITK